MSNPTISGWLATNLVCPRDHKLLTMHKDYLQCSDGHCYPCVDGIPVMLIEESTPTHRVFAETLAISKGHYEVKGRETISLTEVHPYVQKAIIGTNGNLYRLLKNRLTRYPIPDLRLPTGNGQYILDIGCNWGRWCIAAAKKGYQPIGIDPSLEALLAARDIARQLDIKAQYVVADCRSLPFADRSFEVVFSYSVLQHLSRNDVRTTIIDAARVLKPDGQCLIQMPNKLGIRNLGYEIRQGFRDPGGFGVRYWSVKELQEIFIEIVGPTTIFVDGFFSLNPQATDIDLLPTQYKPVVYASEFLRRCSEVIPPLLNFADSLYVAANKTKGVGHFEEISGR